MSTNNFLLAMECIKQIEDYFEYSNESAKDKQKVMGFIENFTRALTQSKPKSPYSDVLRPHIEAGVLQVDTSSRLSLGAKALLEEAETLVTKGILVEISGIHGVRTFQPKQEE